MVVWRQAPSSPRHERATGLSDRRFPTCLLAFCRNLLRKEWPADTGARHDPTQAFRSMRRLYASTPATQFGPKSLRVVRQAMIEHKITRLIKFQSQGE